MLNLNGAGDPLTPGYPAKGEWQIHTLKHVIPVLSILVLKIVLSLAIKLVFSL